VTIEYVYNTRKESR